jgi:opacity protein-like surface antigen
LVIAVSSVGPQRSDLAIAVVLLGSLLIGAVPASAQTIEITPFAGYETSGSYPLENPTDVQALRADAASMYGFFFDYRLIQNVQAEFLWIHNATTYSAARENPDQFAPAFHTSIDQFQFGGLFHLRDREYALRPYIAGGVGFTHDSNAGAFPDRSAFSFSLGGGLKYEPSSHFGLRADARWLPTYGSSFLSSYCDYDGFCYPDTYRNFLQRISLTAGITLRL